MAHFSIKFYIDNVKVSKGRKKKSVKTKANANILS